MSDDRPREWWIFEPDGGDAGMDYDNFGSVFKSPKKSDWKYWDERELKPIHVIEFSAYEELKILFDKATKLVLPGECDTNEAYLKMFRDLQAELELAKEVLQFYAFGRDNGMISGVENDGENDVYIGSRARQVLGELE